MGIYIGSSKKHKISSSNGGIFRLNIPSSTPITNGIRLLTTDNYILQDKNGIYITAKEEK
jgi:hypothetical protein